MLLFVEDKCFGYINRKGELWDIFECFKLAYAYKDIILWILSISILSWINTKNKFFINMLLRFAFYLRESPNRKPLGCRWTDDT